MRKFVLRARRWCFDESNERTESALVVVEADALEHISCFVSTKKKKTKKT